MTNGHGNLGTTNIIAIWSVIIKVTIHLKFGSEPNSFFIWGYFSKWKIQNMISSHHIYHIRILTKYFFSSRCMGFVRCWPLKICSRYMGTHFRTLSIRKNLGSRKISIIFMWDSRSVCFQQRTEKLVMLFFENILLGPFPLYANKWNW